MSYKILFAGIDGSGKSTSADLLTSKLSEKYRILKIGNRNSYISHNREKKRVVPSKWYKLIDHMRILSKKIHAYGFFLVFNILYKYIASKYIVNFIRVDIIMYETDILLHPAVYMTYHFPLTKKLSPRIRFKIVKMLFGFKKNFLIFYLDTDPSIAVERIHRRDVPIQPHENCEDLEVLRNEFVDVLNAASKGGFEIVRINTDKKNLETVVGEMERVLKEKMVLVPKVAV